MHITEGTENATGLLIVDLQEGFGIDESLVRQIANEAPLHARVAMTRFFNEEGSLYRNALNWHEQPGSLLIRPAEAIVLDKNGYGLNERHIAVLRRTGIHTWHVCGVQIDACVMACCFSLWDAGLRPVPRLELCDRAPFGQDLAPLFERQFGLPETRV